MARILICDDSAFMRMMLKKVLIDKGHEVVGEAGNGKQAVQLYREFTPDLVTMDITMPVMDGLEAMKCIREADTQAKIIMVTAIGQQEVVTEAVRAGAADFIVKPFNPEFVIEIIEKVLNNVKRT
ncbi:MAG TPA: response regulator [Patescibacteria group bacterium]|nr:response regulator [Patescibacteria group bacterium]